VRLTSLRLQNFRQHADTHIVFHDGLTGIIGANGSGKTTILEAIAWALYGQDAARGKKETLRWMRAGAGAKVKVELAFELGGHRYFVSRGLTQAELFLDGSDAPIANSLTGVTDVLRRRLGMSREEFFNTYFTGQKELDVMAAGEGSCPAAGGRGRRCAHRDAGGGEYRARARRGLRATAAGDGARR
jgi:exonuclease SbcC